MAHEVKSLMGDKPTLFTSIQGAVVETGFNPKSLNESRVVVVGRPGSGKSSLVHSNPDAVVIDPRNAGRTVPDPKAQRVSHSNTLGPREVAATYRAVFDQLLAMARSGKAGVPKTVVIDTFDDLLDVYVQEFKVLHSVEDPGDYGGGYGKGWNLICNDIFGTLNQLHSAGMGWVVTTHNLPKILRTRDGDQIINTLSVSATFAGAMYKQCDHMLFLSTSHEYHTPAPTVRMVGGRKIETKGTPVKVATRILQATPGGNWQATMTDDAKTRLPLPDSITVPKKGGWAALHTEFELAIAKLIGESNE